MENKKCSKNYGKELKPNSGRGKAYPQGTDLGGVGSRHRNSKQIADRSGVKLTIVRTTLSQLRKAGKIKDTGKDAGNESIWAVVK